MRTADEAGHFTHAEEQYGPFYDQKCVGPEAFIEDVRPFRPGEQGLDMHVHEGLEIGIVLTGQWNLYFGDTRLTCGPGDVWLCAMWEPHGWQVPRDGTTHVVFIFPPDFVGEELTAPITWLRLFAVAPAERPRVADPEMRQTVLDIGHNLRQEIAEERPAWLSVVRLGLVRLLIELSRHFKLPENRAGGRSKGPRPSTLAQIMPAVTLVHDGPANVVLASDAAAACQLSVSRFQHVFRNVMGISFGRFCLRSRLAFCAHRLLTTDAPIEAIASDAGFVDGSHLHRSFVRQYSCTPAEFRRRRGDLSLSA